MTQENYNGKRLYWRIKPEYYRSMNNILGSNYTEKDIDFFVEKHKKGIYAMYNYDDSDALKWGFMPNPSYKEYKDGKFLRYRNSKKWIKEQGYEFVKEFSRVKKLKAINKIALKIDEK